MILFALVVAAATLTVGLAGAWAVGRLPSIRLRLAGLGLLAVALPLAAVALSGAIMFSSGHDLTVLLVATAASTVVLVAAFALARSIATPVERLRSAAETLADGDLAARAPGGGPAEIAELSQAFNDMAANLERLFDGRRELVAWASHDLRTPLASIQAMLEALEDGFGTAERYLPAIGEQVRTLGRLIDDLFELSMIDAGALTLELRDARVENVVASCLRALGAEAERRRVHLEARLTADERARCAPDKLERVLHNLLANALSHTPEDGAVAVVVQRRDGEVLISVEDSGSGFGAEGLRRAFDRFWRADASRSPRAGSGLGLAIARGLVEAQGGRIWAENRADGGARVSFTLPRAG